MPSDRLQTQLQSQLTELDGEGRRKGAERVIEAVLPATGSRGPRVVIGGREFVRMNSNSYLGLSQHPRLIEAEHEAAVRYGVGPGAVRFISGTLAPHAQLEQRLASFHGREAAMLFSSAYAAVLSTLVPLMTDQTAVVSDALNHNCVINALRLARPRSKAVYAHLDLQGLDRALTDLRGAERAVVVTDGIFSMRGAHAPLAEIAHLVAGHDQYFPHNALLVVDDSHGVGAFGLSGRGTEEFTGTHADLLIGTLGKAFGVNGGYVVGPQTLIDFLRETAPMYIFSNPITPPEACAALAALGLLESDWGLERLAGLRHLTERFRGGLRDLGLETLDGAHPVVPLFLRNTQRTRQTVARLYEAGILATGLTFPVVPRGDESIRFQVNADQTEGDIDTVLGALAAVPA
ncbi:aminotransferase class I/II-fold pyridoxal phosphate-dependent enzyme [Deinococcus sp.]|uniref:aminotransferase class I/II-fold pyridoxal phosphate-dependent enzyme n=1 Tax=Deinococcus sp. TaxID=47478 RepID=UPI0025F7C060|nr:aminotransferase class I/II-fold pyridoxal phosphate-dependent enzyme [Deinococcus sp.]